MVAVDRRDLSIVFQGPVVQRGPEARFSTEEALLAARSLFPDATLILSTWSGSPVPDVPRLRTVLSDDPGAVRFSDRDPKLNNLNRMLLSTRAGLAASATTFALKLRTDMMPTSTGFIALWERLGIEPRQYGIFARRLLAYPVYTLAFEKGERTMPKPFHVSDWAFFGLRADIETLFRVPDVVEPGFSRFFEGRGATGGFDTFPDHLWRYTPEQYVVYSAFSRRFPEVRFDHKRDYDRRNIRASRVAIPNNFVILDPDQWALRHAKPFYDRPLHEFDPICYPGFIQFGGFVRGHLRHVGWISPSLLVGSQLRLLRSRAAFRIRALRAAGRRLGRRLFRGGRRRAS